MRPGIALRPDYDAAQLWALRKRPGTRVKVGGCWRWPKSTTAAPGPKRRGSAASGCRRPGLGSAVQRPRPGRLDRRQGSREHLQAE